MSFLHSLNLNFPFIDTHDYTTFRRELQDELQDNAVLNCSGSEIANI